MDESKGYKKMFERNTKEINRLIAHMFAWCTIAVAALVICSWLGVFEFGKVYTRIILVAGLLITVSPSLLHRILPADVMRYYMLIMLSVFIGVLGTNNHIGIYITYALVPIFSCLYFDPKFTLKISVFSYITMVVSIYFNSAHKYEVLYMGMPRMKIFIAYALGYTMEYVIVGSILYLVVKRAKRMMEERYSAEEENRMKSQFLSSMSHEIRTPMNAIIGMSDVALRKDMEPDVCKCIKVIKSSSTGLLQIINDILDLSKIEAGKLNIMKEPYKTAMLAEDMMAVVDARNASHRVPIYYHISDQMPETLEGDETRIKQVMLNYASNAIKYTDHGRIDIYLDCSAVEAGYVTLRFSVKDTGQGIRAEDMDKLFQMYSQLEVEKNHNKEGTGIGLAISKYFIDEMGGTVDVQSVYGEGSTFSFAVVQKVIYDYPDDEEKAGHVEPYCFTTEHARILLVDDNEINREVLKEILEPLALTIDEAENGQEAVEMADGEIVYDMILMDSHMPVMNGEEATEQIRHSSECINQNVPIIALTADAIAGVRERLLGKGMNDYIVKPVNMEVICDMIRKYLPEEKIVLKDRL